MAAARVVGFNVESLVKDLFRTSIITAFPAVKVPDILVVPGKKADFQCNNAMALAKALAQAGTPMSPKQVAEEMIRKLPANDLIQVASANDQGFVNVDVEPQWTARAMHRLVSLGSIPPPQVTKEQVLVDFSSPNIAKEMHVGHLRSTIIGECICRLFEYVGHDVRRINHVGDWGTQFGMLILYLKQSHPDFLSNPPDISDLMAFYKAAKARFDADGEFKEQARLEVVKLQSGDAECLQAWKLFCDISRAEFQQIYDRLDVTLEERGESFYNPHIPQVLQLLQDSRMLETNEGAKLLVSREWKLLTEIDAKIFSKLIGHFFQEKRDGTWECSPVILHHMRALKLLAPNEAGVETVNLGPKESKPWAKFDLTKDIDKLVKQLEPIYKPTLHADLVTELAAHIDGNRIHVPKFSFPLIAQKSDGGYTYDTTDLAAIHHRFVVEKYSRVVYVTDVGQFEHFNMVAQAAQDMGWMAGSARWQHAGFGLVSGEDGKKLKTRSGDTIKLKDLLDEAKDRCLATLVEREATPQAQGHTPEDMQRLSRIIGYGAVKYFDLRQNRLSDYSFGFDKVLDMNGNTAVFLLYSYARICSIKRKCGDVSIPDLVATTQCDFPTKAEKELALYTLRFEATLLKTMEDLMPKNITEYVYDLVNAFSSFYRDCRVHGDPLQNSRLILIEGVRMSIETALNILGIKVADRL